MIKINPELTKNHYEEKVEELQKEIDNAPEWKKRQLESKLSILKRKKQPKFIHVGRKPYVKKGEN
jgi:hypothetical protein